MRPQADRLAVLPGAELLVQEEGRKAGSCFRPQAVLAERAVQEVEQGAAFQKAVAERPGEFQRAARAGVRPKEVRLAGFRKAGAGLGHSWVISFFS